MPDHPVIQAISTGDREEFLSAEAQDREDNMMPPFGRLVGIIVSGADEAAVEQAVKALNQTAPRDNKIQTLGPAEAPIKLLAGSAPPTVPPESKKKREYPGNNPAMAFHGSNTTQNTRPCGH